MSDVGRRSRAATRSSHDVTGQDINLNFPDSKFGSTARLGSSDVAQDRRPTEKQAPAGKLACFSHGALGTHKAGRSASESWCGRAGWRYTGSTGHDFHCDQQKRGDGPRHCICHKLGTIRFARAAGLTLNYTELYTYIRARMRKKKKSKHFLRQKRV